MSLENLEGNNVFIANLNKSWPTDNDFIDEGDNHIRGVKNVLQNTFPNFNEALVATPEEIDALVIALGDASSASLVPVGAIIDFAGLIAPVNFVVCNGQELLRDTYAQLFAAIGTVWGIGNNVTTFNVPNLNGRATLGSGLAHGAQIAATVGSLGGVAEHLLTHAQLPAVDLPSSGAHQHPLVLQSTGPGSIVQPDLVAQNTQSLESLTSILPAGAAHVHALGGGNQAHPNLQPSAVVLKIIRVL